MKEKIEIILKSKKVHTCISFIIFGYLAINVFLGITYLFRNSTADRNHITGIKEVSNVDMVYIGGSAAVRYWETPIAWNEYGITSYTYGTKGIEAETIKGEIEEVLKYQNPNLMVIGVRAFLYWKKNTFHESGIRNVTDSMDYSLNRFLTVANCFKYRQLTGDVDYVSYFLDIAKYHTNYANLSNENAWELVGNIKASNYNGSEFASKHEALVQPKDIFTNEKQPILEESEKILRDLLEYCSNKNLNVMFVVSPYDISLDEQKQYNYMKDIIESYGYNFLNANNYYDEIGIDFEKDFYNVNHTNLFGAEKYTKYLAKYIKSNYSIADHRNDENYSDWNSLYQKFAAEEPGCKTMIEKRILNKQKSYENGQQLKNINNPYEWLESIKNKNYYILLESNGSNWSQSFKSNRILEQFNIPLNKSSNKLRVYIGTKSYYEKNTKLDENFKEIFAGHSDYNETYEMNCGTNSTITIAGREFSKMKDGLNIVVYDKNYREVLDSVTLVQNELGEIRLVR